MRSRRAVLGAGAAGLLSLTAGCIGFVRGSEPLEFGAERAGPDETVVAEAGYESDERREEALEESFGVRDVEREVRASFWLSTYTKRVEYGGETREASVFAAVSLPGMSVLGHSFNPLEDASNEELLEEVLSRIDVGDGPVEGLEHEEAFTLDVLDDVRDVDAFRGATEIDGEAIDVRLTLTSFEHEGDLLVLLGSHPRELAREAAITEELMESVEHPV